ncbi:GTP 3',8-cyclase MoaA [Falsibacillus pallidus]|uniref:GTP 3',8-cyclase n=1 Tax=Falsibacillus pallidus TaxID=493781 RepID=A0A370GJ07_9BACI|nr:GTP 3',8-cyclase MoaA [Falsibacillus pallidus]RDI43199.1 cyclic pyranopterin monophosphate synthase subunit MoaA [Falsibacillus pallidus]
MKKAIDQLSRPFKDLRISVTDRCNFRCRYCMPAEIFGPDYAFLPKQEILSFEEIERITKASVNLGVRKVKLTGGEPLIRKNLHQLIRKLYEIEEIEDIGLTTNGILLPTYADRLKEAGLKRINISLDALEENLFKKMNGVGASVEKVKAGIDAAIQAGLKVKINMVVQKGVNEDEIIPMAEYCKVKEIPLRFIEFMDVGNSNGWNWDQIVTKKEMMGILASRYELIPIEPDYYGEVAKRYRLKGSDSEIGFITSVSETFCSECTRGRISANGSFYTCLFAQSGVDLKEDLRNGMTDTELMNKLNQIWNNRNDRYSEERTEESAVKRKKIEMSYIGG